MRHGNGRADPARAGAILALVAIAFTMAGCGGSGGGGINSTPPPATAPTTPTTPAPPTTTPVTPPPTPSTTVPIPLALQGGAILAEATFNIAQTGTASSNRTTTTQANATNLLPTGSNISYNPTTNIYTLNDGLGGFGSQQFAPGNLVGNSSDYISYDNRLSDIGATLKLLAPGQANPVIALTYVSFGILQYFKPTVTPAFGGGLPNTTYLVFGQQTPMAGLPASGSASYSGILAGAYNSAAGNFDLKGVVTLNANFAARTMSTSLTVNGTGTASGQALALGTFTGTSAIGATNGNATFGGSLANPANPRLTGLFGGNFYGPAASEFGYSFSLKEVTATGATASVGGGVAVGH